MSNEALITELAPVLQRLKQLNLADPESARRELEVAFPNVGSMMQNLNLLCAIGRREGWLCDKEGGGSRFSRVAKADKGSGYSIDAVLLSGDGPWHKHVKGEVNCMFAVDGQPEFCGHKPGWAVFPPGSQHVPSVKGGTMMILYMLPDGAVEWKKT